MGEPIGKPLEKHWKPIGKPWENPWENHWEKGKPLGKWENHWKTHWKTHGTTTTVELSETKTSIVHRYVQEGHSCKYHTHDLRGFRTGIKMFPRFSRSIYPRFIHASISNVRSFYHSIVLSCFIGIPSSWMIIPNRGANITAYKQSTRLLNKQNLTHPYSKIPIKIPIESLKKSLLNH